MKLFRVYLLLLMLVAFATAKVYLDAALIDQNANINCAEIDCPKTAPSCPMDSVLSDGHADEDEDENEYKYEFKEFNSRKRRDLQEICCGNTKRCVCNAAKCPEIPKCPNDEVAWQLIQGTGEPGSCCSSYQCAPDTANFNQSGVGEPIFFYRDKCTKCTVVICIDECPQEELEEGPVMVDEMEPYLNCITFDKQYKLHGESWLESNGCSNCTCYKGTPECTTSVCRQIDCDIPTIRVEGVCCPICPEPATKPAFDVNTARSSADRSAINFATTAALPILLLIIKNDTISIGSSTSSSSTTSDAPSTSESSSLATATAAEQTHETDISNNKTQNKDNDEDSAIAVTPAYSLGPDSDSTDTSTDESMSTSSSSSSISFSPDIPLSSTKEFDVAPSSTETLHILLISSSSSSSSSQNSISTTELTEPAEVSNGWSPSTEQGVSSTADAPVSEPINYRKDALTNDNDYPTVRHDCGNWEWYICSVCVPWLLKTNLCELIVYGIAIIVGFFCCAGCGFIVFKKYCRSTKVISDSSQETKNPLLDRGQRQRQQCLSPI